MLTYRSAAKINLYLSVKGLLPGGYHELTSIMQSVSLWDTLTFDFGRRNFSLSVPGFSLGAAEDNIVARVWRLMRRRFALPGEIHVVIDKKIPVGAGLAGGSGNGAAALYGINDYFNLGLSQEELAAIGGEIGADIPFCVIGGAALARGKGEKLAKLPSLPDCILILTEGGFHVATKEIFSAFDQLPLRETDKEAKIIQAMEKGDIVTAAANMYNDLERVTIPLYPALAHLKEYYLSLGFYPLMSGSGPTIFALVPAGAEEKAKEAIKTREEKSYIVRPADSGVVKIK